MRMEMLLRNLARNLSKTEAEETATKLEGGVSWVERLFKPVEPRLFEVTAHNKSLVGRISTSRRAASNLRIALVHDRFAQCD
jgi:hypothetical protein